MAFIKQNRSTGGSIVMLMSLSLATVTGIPAIAAPAPQTQALMPLANITREAVTQQKRVPHITLAALDAPIFQEAELRESLLEEPTNGQIPNYLRALAVMPQTVKPFAHLVKTAIYSGSVAPEVKIAMGARIAQMHRSVYVAAHMVRLLQARTPGQVVLANFQGKAATKLSPAHSAALRYAELLTRDVNGVRDVDFQEVRRYYNDSQIVELTMTVSFFNYFTRLCEGLNLPVEPWLANPIKLRAVETYEAPFARVALISDMEAAAFSRVAAARGVPGGSSPSGGSGAGGVPGSSNAGGEKVAVSPASASATATINPATSTPTLTPATSAAEQARSGLGLGVLNAQRAMSRVPGFQAAWTGYWSSARNNEVLPRAEQLQVSFAVSMANRCRYCTLHQVQGLRRIGVDPARLIAMKKDDNALTPRELVAVQFARKLTREPASVTHQDYQTLRGEYGEQGALAVLLQTCAFNFMNRFTDGLGLPSEDGAIKTYREVYGTDYH